MRITQKQILHALGLEVGDLSTQEIAVSLKNIESILDNVAENMDNDLEAASLGDASNLVQTIRESLNV